MSGVAVGITVVNKVNSGIKVSNGKKAMMNQGERKMVCSALLRSNFDYVFNFWFRELSRKL